MDTEWKTVIFRQGNAIMETIIGSTGGLPATAPVRIFDGGWTLPQLYSFYVMPDGHHLVMIHQPREVVQTLINVVVNWFPVLIRSA